MARPKASDGVLELGGLADGPICVKVERMQFSAVVNAVSLYTADLDAARAFYSGVLGLDVVFEEPGDVLVFRCGSIMLNLTRERPDETDPGEIAGRQGASGFSFNCWVDDVDAVAAELVARGGVLLTPLVDRPWGMRNVTIADPAGHVWEFGQRLVD